MKKQFSLGFLGLCLFARAAMADLPQDFSRMLTSTWSNRSLSETQKRQQIVNFANQHEGTAAYPPAHLIATVLEIDDDETSAKDVERKLRAMTADYPASWQSWLAKQSLINLYANDGKSAKVISSAEAFLNGQGLEVIDTSSDPYLAAVKSVFGISSSALKTEVARELAAAYAKEGNSMKAGEVREKYGVENDRQPADSDK